MPDSEPAPAATADAGATPAAGDPPADTGDRDGLGDAGRKALADIRRELKAVSKERDDVQRQLRERQDAERTDLERLTAERETLTAERETLLGRVATLEREGRARAAAIEAGIPDLWDRLKGDDEAELLDDAKAMAERLGVGRQPARDLGAGARDAAPATGNAAMNERIRRSARR